MTGFGDDLIQALNEALAHAKGQGPSVVHVPVKETEPVKRGLCPAASEVRDHDS